MEINYTTLNIFGTIVVILGLIIIWAINSPDDPDENEDNRGNLKSSESQNRNQ